MPKSGKISVKHYLDKRGIKKESIGPTFYPLYVRVIVKRMPYYFPSQISEFDGRLLNEISEDKFAALLERKDPQFSKALEMEKLAIREIIEMHDPWNKNSFTLQNFSYKYKNSIERIYGVFDRQIQLNLIEKLSLNYPTLHRIIKWDKGNANDILDELEIISQGGYSGTTYTDDRIDSELYLLIKNEIELFNWFEMFLKNFDDTIRYYQWIKFSLGDRFLDFIKRYSDANMHDFTVKFLKEMGIRMRDITGL